MTLSRLSPFALLLVLACGDQDVDKNTETGEPGDTGPDASYMVDVTADGASASVDIATLTTTTFEDNQVVPLVDVLEASGLSATWADRTYNFAASDGFSPLDKDCEPVDYTMVQSGYIYPESGNVVWDAALDMPGCYFVDGVATIEVQDLAR